MSKTRYQLIGIRDNVYGTEHRVLSDLPLNTPIMFVKGKARLGFKRLPTLRESKKLIYKPGKLWQLGPPRKQQV